ncbi:MAG: DsbA family protein [archaeon]
MEKQTLIYIMLGVMLVLTLVNAFSNAELNQKLDVITAQIALSNANTIGVDSGISETAPSVNNQLTVNQPAPVVNASADDDTVKGAENAPVTIIEFSDYQCPFCERFYAETLPSIQQKYIDSGKVKLVYRDFPLGFHENAQKAAEAAECAGEQGKYWEMHNKIFDNQTAIDIVSLKQYAVQLGLNQEKFNQCLDSSAMASEVQKDFADGQKYGVTATPTFFVNNTKLVGAQPFSAFEQLIESELAKEVNK